MAWAKFKKRILTYDMSCAIHIGMELMNFIFESMDLGIYIIQADARKKVQPCGLVVKENIQYGKDEFDNVFDVYYPENCQDKKLPTILHIHGGGYVAGSRDIACFWQRRAIA